MILPAHSSVKRSLVTLLFFATVRAISHKNDVGASVLIAFGLQCEMEQR
ncbi:unnamed protein product [Brugia timori]|uniref:Secreted protein n=1 Tax=Brugia timori TaxID=42155 RepID=A0A0R3QSW7_9BILA|nr:unnamed protein product [Brugia timori]